MVLVELENLEKVEKMKENAFVYYRFDERRMIGEILRR